MQNTQPRTIEQARQRAQQLANEEGRTYWSYAILYGPTAGKTAVECKEPNPACVRDIIEHQPAAPAVALNVDALQDAPPAPARRNHTQAKEIEGVKIPRGFTTVENASPRVDIRVVFLYADGHQCEGHRTCESPNWNYRTEPANRVIAWKSIRKPNLKEQREQEEAPTVPPPAPETPAELAKMWQDRADLYKGFAHNLSEAAAKETNKSEARRLHIEAQESAHDAATYEERAAQYRAEVNDAALIPTPDANTPSEERARYFDQEAKQYESQGYGYSIHAANSRTIAAHIRSKATTEPTDTRPALAPNEATVYALLDNKGLEIDDIAAKAGLAAGTTNAALVMLEIKGYAQRLPGFLFRLMPTSEPEPPTEEVLTAEEKQTMLNAALQNEASARACREQEQTYLESAAHLEASASNPEHAAHAKELLESAAHNRVCAEGRAGSAEMYEARAAKIRAELNDIAPTDDDPTPPAGEPKPEETTPEADQNTTCSSIKEPKSQPETQTEVWQVVTHGSKELVFESRPFPRIPVSEFKGPTSDKSGITVEVNTDGLTVTTIIDGHEFRPRTFKKPADRDRHIQTRANLFAGYDLTFTGSDEEATPKKRATRKPKAPAVAPHLLEIAQKLELWADKHGVDLLAVLNGETPSDAPAIIAAVATDQPLTAPEPTTQEPETAARTEHESALTSWHALGQTATREEINAASERLNQAARVLEDVPCTPEREAAINHLLRNKAWFEESNPDPAKDDVYQQWTRNHIAQELKRFEITTEEGEPEECPDPLADMSDYERAELEQEIIETEARAQFNRAKAEWLALDTEVVTWQELETIYDRMNDALAVLEVISGTPEHAVAQQMKAEREALATLTQRAEIIPQGDEKPARPIGFSSDTMTPTTAAMNTLTTTPARPRTATQRGFIQRCGRPTPPIRSRFPETTIPSRCARFFDVYRQIELEISPRANLWSYHNGARCVKLMRPKSRYTLNTIRGQ